MKKIFIILLLLFVSITKSIGQVTFQKTYGGSYDDGANSVQLTSDGGYIVAGYSYSYNSGSNTDIYVIRTNSVGDTLWTKAYGGDYADGAVSIQQTYNGDFIIGGNTQSCPPGQFCLLKLDSNGDFSWSRTYGGTSENNHCNSIEQTKDSGFIMTGNYSDSMNYEQLYLAKIKSNGDTSWTKIFNINGTEQGRGVRQTNDGGYIVVGNTSSYSVGNEDLYAIKTSSNGSVQWTKVYGGSIGYYGQCVEQTKDEGFIFGGIEIGYLADTMVISLIRTDANGDTLWTKTYQGDQLYLSLSVKQTNDNGFIMGGFTSQYSFDNAGTIFLTKLDSAGNIQWSKLIGGTYPVTSYSVEQTTDRGYIIAGSLDVIPYGYDVYLIKTDSLGNAGCNDSINPNIIVSRPTVNVGNPTARVSSGGIVTVCSPQKYSGGIASTLCSSVGIKELNEDNNFSIFPNPATNQLTIRTSLKDEYATVSIMNLLGQTSPPAPLYTDRGDALIDVSKLAAGMYFLQLKTESGSVVSKFVKE